MRRLFFDHIDQAWDVIADGALAVFIESGREPNGAAIGERTEASIDVIKARIDQLDRNHQTVQDIRDAAMRADIGAKFVAAKKRVTGKERVTFSLKKLIVRQPDNFVAVLFHPLRKKRRFPGPLFVPKITRDEFSADGQPGVGGKDHVGQLRLWRDEMDVASKAKEFLVQSAPLRLDEWSIGATGAAHPWIDFVFDAVVIGRAKQKIAHTGC